MPAEHAYVPNMTRPMTAEDLLQPDVPEHAELVRGVLVVREPPGFRHGEITVRLASALMIHVDAHNLGRVGGIQAAIGSRYGARRRHRVRQLGTTAAAIARGLPAARPGPRCRSPVTR